MDHPLIESALATLIRQLLPSLPPDRADALRAQQRAALLGRELYARVDGSTASAVLLALDPERARAALVGLSPVTAARGDAALALYDALEAELAARGAECVVATGGPAGGYLVSGLDARDEATRDALAARGFAEHARHVDLHATLAPPRTADDARVRRAPREEAAAVCAWVASRFAPAWGREVARAFGEAARGVFVAGAPGAYQGFAAHSGNNAALGTFGPVGVEPAARGAGLGAALARAALDDLARRGFARATIPWVDPARVPFYTALVAQLEVEPRVVLRKRVAPTR